MELDELKNRVGSVKAPEGISKGSGMRGGSLDGLVRMMKEQDAKEQIRLRRAKTFFGIAALLYAAIFTLTWILPPDGPAGRSRLVLALYTLIFVAIVTASVVRARRIAATDYSAPVGTFLKESERRYTLVNWREIWLFVPFFVIATLTAGLGWMNGFARYFSYLDESTGLLAFVVFWLVACIFAVAFGLLWWKKHRAPLLDEIRRLRSELASE